MQLNITLATFRKKKIVTKNNELKYIISVISYSLEVILGSINNRFKNM